MPWPPRAVPDGAKDSDRALGCLAMASAGEGSRNGQERLLRGRVRAERRWRRQSHFGRCNFAILGLSYSGTNAKSEIERSYHWGNGMTSRSPIFRFPRSKGSSSARKWGRRGRSDEGDGGGGRHSAVGGRSSAMDGGRDFPFGVVITRIVKCDGPKKFVIFGLWWTL